MLSDDTPNASHLSEEELSDSASLSTAISVETQSLTQDHDREEHNLLKHLDMDSRGSKDHELSTAPLFTRDAYSVAGGQSIFPQRGLLGSILEIYNRSGSSPADVCKDSRVYFNTNAPCSTLVCGVQGSGKSHTVSTLLENMLIANDPRIGLLKKPLSALILHFGEGGPFTQPCEAAWIGLGVSHLSSANPPPVRVFVSSSSLNTMKAVYARLGPNVTVEPLLFSEAELDAQAFLSMMAIGSNDHVPLYMQTVLAILRELGENYTYRAFMNALALKKKTLNPAQLSGLEQRMALLETFLDKQPSRKKQTAPSRFMAGQLTIIDLSDPFIDPASACGFFEIVTRLFVRAQVDGGKVLVVDEAHKYLSANQVTSGLTGELLSLIRQQRHLAMRVIISTQEPTVVPPTLLGLCGIFILHRFSSPAWWEHVAKHVPADMDGKEAFDRIVNLQTGQAIVLAPSSLFVHHGAPPKSPANDGPGLLSLIGRRCMLVKTRQRISADGGASILSVKL